MLEENHAHSRGLETHCQAVIASAGFDGQSAVRRHQVVYAARRGPMGEIHVLALHAYATKEWALQDGGAPDSPQCMGGSRRDRRSPGFE